MEQVIDVPSQEIITKDNASVKVDGVAFFQVLDARRAAYEVSDLQSALLNLVMTNVRTVMGSMDLDQLLSHRDDINGRLLTVIDAASEPWGIKVTRVEIKDIEPPKDLIDAMARQMKAEREKRAVILEAEGMRQSDITRAEGEGRPGARGEGRRDAAYRAAEAIERTAQAEARRTRLVSEATPPASGRRQFLIAEKYIGALHALAQSPNPKLVIVPMELLARRHARRPEPDRGRRARRRGCRLGGGRGAREAGGRRSGHRSGRAERRPVRRSGRTAAGRRPSAVERLRRTPRWTCLSTCPVSSPSPGSSSASRSAPSRRSAPGAFFIWFGAAAAIVGVVDYVLPMGFVAQLVLFAVLVGGPRPRRPPGLRVVRGGARSAAPEPGACDDRRRFLPRRSDRARLRPDSRRRQFLAGRGRGLPGGRPGPGGRGRGRLAAQGRAGGVPPAAAETRFSGRRESGSSSG